MMLGIFGETTGGSRLNMYFSQEACRVKEEIVDLNLVNL